MKGKSASTTGIAKIGEYQDELHAEDMEGVYVADYGYKYRVINGVMLPPM